MTPTGIRIGGTIDGQTDLLDRQIVTSDGLLIAKVDDIEIEQYGDALTVTGFLVGPGALGPRLGGALEYLTVNTWSRLSRRNSADPRRIDYTHVSGISTVIAVDQERRSVQIDGFETWTRIRIIEALPGAGRDPDPEVVDKVGDHLGEGPPRRGPRYRFSQLAGMKVQFADGSEGGQVTDVRMTRGELSGHLPRLSVEGLIVGRNRPGTLFGYDRNRQQGPWLIQQVLRWVHRHTGYVAWTDIEAIDWTSHIVRIAANHLQSVDDL